MYASQFFVLSKYSIDIDMENRMDDLVVSVYPHVSRKERSGIEKGFSRRTRSTGTQGKREALKSMLASEKKK